MADEILTYESIRKAQKDEADANKLAKLPEIFFRLVQEYVSTKEGMLADAMDKNEFQNMKRILQDVFERREHKILKLALYSVRTGIPPENLLPDEKKFFERVVDALKEFRRVIESATEPRRNEPLKLVALMEALPAFTGADANSYGPFRPGDIAMLPLQNAELLISEKKAEEIKADKQTDDAMQKTG